MSSACANCELRRQVSAVSAHSSRHATDRFGEFVRSPDSAKEASFDQTAPKTVHQLKVTLRGVKPPVLRRIVVRSDTRLSELAPLLESAMGWFGGHLHLFEAAGKRYGEPDPDWGGVLDERGRKLATVMPEVGSKMRFDYDFGDGWEHDVVVEAIEPAERGVRYPQLLAGKRACPPDDCGGPWGYQNLLEALADPKHRPCRSHRVGRR